MMILLALALASAPADTAPKVAAEPAKAERAVRLAPDARASHRAPKASRLDALERTVDALEPEVPIAVDTEAGPTGL